MDSKKFYECWKYIEKRAFSPGPKDIERWLNCFVTFFYTIYERGTNFPKTRDKGENKFCSELIFSSIDTRLKFSIKPANNIPNFSVELKWGKNNSDKANLQFEYDSSFQCEWDYINESKICQKDKSFNEGELNIILNNMIVHPAIHCHMDGEILKEIFPRTDIHEIRLGMPTTNPFLFLYQVSFQFLSIIEERKKQAELKRLAGVIWENKDKMSISPGILFKI
ncbi:MAG: hypothetical protein NT166_19775 [Candidatus Aminicenantes bacterium]|nr:hypothetical protein [Candidatus Aminicenantes bacterium]